MTSFIGCNNCAVITEHKPVPGTVEIEGDLVLKERSPDTPADQVEHTGLELSAEFECQQCGRTSRRFLDMR